MFRVGSGHVQSMFRACSENVLSVFRACSGYVHGLFRVCSGYASFHSLAHLVCQFLAFLYYVPSDSNPIQYTSLFGMGASDLHISGTWKNVPICCDTPKEPKIPGGFLRVYRLFCRFYQTRVRSLHYRLSNGNYELKKKCLKVNIYFVLSFRQKQVIHFK